MWWKCLEARRRKWVLGSYIAACNCKRKAESQDVGMGIRQNKRLAEKNQGQSASGRERASNTAALSLGHQGRLVGSLKRLECGKSLEVKRDLSGREARAEKRNGLFDVWLRRGNGNVTSSQKSYFAIVGHSKRQDHGLEWQGGHNCIAAQLVSRHQRTATTSPLPPQRSIGTESSSWSHLQEEPSHSDEPQARCPSRWKT